MMSIRNPLVNTEFLSLIFLYTKSNVTIANPKWIKAVKGNKDDTNASTC